MPVYVPTTWANDTTPAINATNLNKLVTELISQAAAMQPPISHTLPTWVNGSAPAVSDPVPLNEMERVTAAVATALGLVPAYTPTTWSSGWIPARNATRLNHMEAQIQANRNVIDNPPPSGSYIDQINELTSVFIPTNTAPANITQGVTNPPGLGGGVWEVADVAGSGFRFVATPQMPAPWQSTKKVCFAQMLIRPAVGLYESWSFKYRYPIADNPAFPSLFHAGTIWEFGHPADQAYPNSGVYIGLDGRVGGEGHYIGVPTGDFTNVGAFTYYHICSKPQLVLGKDYLCEARLRYNADLTGYCQIKVDGVTIVDKFCVMRPPTSSIPKPQPGWYSDSGTTANGVEIRNISYAYGV